MSEQHADGRLDAWQGRLDRISGAVPYLLLAVAATLAGLDSRQSWAARLATLGLAGLAAAWMLWMVTLHPAWVGRRRLMAAYYCGLLGLLAALIARNSWFGIFAFTGYLHAWYVLARRWRLLGVTATAILSATWQTGGLPAPTLPAIATYLLIIAVTVILVSLFSAIGELTAAQSARRKRVIAELAEANRRLEETLAENAGLQAQVLAQAREAGVLDERQRMAGEIHDTLAQNLAGIITQLEAAEQTSRSGEEWRRHLGQARALARESLGAARRSVQALRPEPLERQPLPEAIAELADGWAAANPVEVRFEATGSPRPLLDDIESALFRVAQESLANVARHARAARVGLTLSYMDDVVLLDVRDDGVGFAPDAGAGQGFGLRAMEQRLRRVAGALEIESAPGAGTAINASVPAIAAEGGDNQ